MSAVLADTHAALWFLKLHPSLSQAARLAMRQASAGGDPILISAVSLIEICYLIEKSRLPISDWTLVVSSIGTNGVTAPIEVVPVSYAVTQILPHIPRDTVPDMPDRIIAATALHLGVPLVSRDRKIQAASIQTIW